MKLRNSLPIKTVLKAIQLKEQGYYWNGIALELGVNYNRLLKYIRNYQRYGESYWSDQPMEVKQ